METAARQIGVDPAELRRKNFITQFPHQTPVIMAYDAGDYDASLDAAHEGVRLRRLSSAQGGGAKSEGKLRGIGMSCYIEACGIAPSAAVGSLGAGVGLWESAEVRVNPVGTIEVLTGRTATARATRRRSRKWSPAASASRSTGLDRPRRHRQGAVRHGHLRLALGGGRHVGHRQGARQGRGQGQEDRRPSARGSESDIVIEERRVQGRRHRQDHRAAEVALAAYTAHNLPAGMEPGLKESAFYDPSNFTFPAGCLHLRGRGRSRRPARPTSSTSSPPTISAPHQPDDRRGAGPWRHRAGHRPGAAGGRASMTTSGQLADGVVHGLRHAARGRSAVLQGVDTPTRHARAIRSA